MNKRENANESLRISRSAYFLLLMICILVSGCAIASETNRVFFLAKRTTHIEPKFYRYIRSDRLAQREARQLAEQAWADYVNTTAKPDLTPDFENGFIEGFADYLYRGGSGQPPVVPPRGYWNLRFLNQYGKVSIDEWYEGFRQGAQDCKARGLRDMWVVPTSLYANETEEDTEAAAKVSQPEHHVNMHPSRPDSATESQGTPTPEPEPYPEPQGTEASRGVEPDAEDAEPELEPEWPDEEPEPPQIDEELLIDDSLSILEVRPATRIPDSSKLDENSVPESVVQASNHVDVAPSKATKEPPLVKEFKNILRQSNAEGNRLRAPTDVAGRERLRIVYEPVSSPTAAVRDKLDQVPVIPLELSPQRTAPQRPLPSQSAAKNWQADGRAQELPLKVTGAGDDEAMQDAAREAVSPGHEFDELEMLLSSAEDAGHLPRIVDRSDRKDIAADNREGTAQFDGGYATNGFKLGN